MKKQILMSIMAIGITSMLMVTGTFASFYGPKIDMRAKCLNLIDIRDNDDWWGHDVKATWTASNMAPGDEFPFSCSYVGLKKHRFSIPAHHIKIKCYYSVINDNLQMEGDAGVSSNICPDSMAKQMIITRCRYLGFFPFVNINCLTNSNPDKRINDIDGDGKITFYDFKHDSLDNLPSPRARWGRYWFVLSVKFDENAGNRFQGKTFNFTLGFEAVLRGKL